MQRQPHPKRLALDIRRGIWALHQPESWLPIALKVLRGETVATDYDDDDDAAYAEADGQKIVIIPLHSAITKYDTCFSYGMLYVGDRIKDLADDPACSGLILDIDSGGGSVNAIAPIKEAIAYFKATGKPVIAHCDACFSAAYWIASMCDSVFADNKLSEFGSIGVYSQLIDDREDKQTGTRIISVYAKESPDKNADYREALDGKPERLQAKLTPIAQAFHADVKAGRQNLQAEAPGVLTGDTYYAEEAIRLGLADGILTLEQCVENIFIRTNIN